MLCLKKTAIIIYPQKHVHKMNVHANIRPITSIVMP